VWKSEQGGSDATWSQRKVYELGTSLALWVASLAADDLSPASMAHFQEQQLCTTGATTTSGRVRDSIVVNILSPHHAM
jgi:hypothetical protein